MVAANCRLKLLFTNPIPNSVKLHFSILTLGAALLLAGANTSVGQTSLFISNNSFETPASGSQNIYISGATGTSGNMTGWTTVSTQAGYWSTRNTNGSLSGVTNVDAAQVVEAYNNGGGAAGYIYQELTNRWIPGAIYTLTARAGQATNSANTPNTGDTFSIDANSGGTLTQLSSATISNAKSGLLNYTVNYTATGNEPGDGFVVVGFHVPSQANLGGMWIDDFAINYTAADPAITVPGAQTVQPGQTATFSVTALGATPFSYQWQATNAASGGFTNLANGGQISGVNTNVLSVANAATNSVRFYRVIATDTAGSVTSSVASLTVNTALLIDGDIGPGALQTGAAILGAAGDIWNNLTGPGTFSTVVNSGNSTLSGISVTVDSGSTAFNTASPTVDPATAALMSDFVYRAPGGAAVPVTISGLGAYVNQPFTLVVYAGMDPGQPCTENISTGATGGNTTSTLNTTSATRKLSDGIGVAYNTFTGTLTNGTLTFTVSGTSYHGPNGFQLQIQFPNPGIATQPVSQAVPTGSTVAFSVVPSGNSPFGYQWQANGGSGYTNLIDGGTVSGSGTTTLTLSAVTANNALNYQVIVTNSFGSITSAPASLTVTAPALIDVDVGGGPVQSGAAVLGTAADVAWNSYSSVGASSLSNLKDSGGNTLTGVGLNISGGYAYGNDTTAGTLDAATTPLMQDFLFNTGALMVSVTGLTGYSNYPYTLVVYAAGTTYSGAQAATVAVTAGSTGTTPASGIVTSASRKISLGNGVAYQKFTGIFTGSTLTFTVAPASSGGINLNGLQLQFSPLAITTQPVSQTTSQGGTALFTVGAVGTGPLNYQWQVTNSGTGTFVNLTDGGQFSGSQTNTLSIANLVTNNSLAYQVIVSLGNYSVTSSPAILAVQTAPVITSQPTSQTVVIGNTATFSVNALGSAPLSYQWQANGVSGYTNLIDGGQISGAGTNVLTISPVSANWGLAYRVIVTNSIGSITSSVASLTVAPNTLNIDVDFGSGATQSGSAVVGAPGDVWNAVAATTGTIKNTANATLSGVGLTLTSSGVNTDTGGTAMDAATSPLMQDYTYGNNSTVTVSLTGLAPYINSPFTLVVYSAGDSSGQGGILTLTGAASGNTAGTLVTSGISRKLSAGTGVAYNTFSGSLTNGTLTFTCTALTSQQYTEVNGFQLQFAPATNDPSLLVAPNSQTVPAGSTATFNATAGGTAPFSYQWQVYSGTGFTNLTDGGQVSGSNTNVLTIAGATASYVQPNWNWAGIYRVIVTNSVGSITSSPAALIIAASGVYVPPGGNANNAIYAAYSAGGGTVNLGAGNYGPISMWANVTLNGAGSNSVVTSITDGSDSGNAFYRDNETIQNLLIDGGLSCSAMSVGQIVGAGVLIGAYYPVDTHNITFRNVEIKNTGMAMQIVNVSGVHLFNCNFHDNCYPSGFDHSIYFTGDYDVEMYNCISSWCRAGDGAHLDFSSNIGVPNIFNQCEFNGTAGLGILNQNYNGSGNDVHFNGCKFQFNGQSGGDGDGIDTDLAGYVQASRLEFNHGYGANIRNSVGLFYDYFNGNSTDLYYSYGPVAAIASGSTPNAYDAVLADGVTGVNNTADWSTIYNGTGSATEGVVDFNANHSTNGLLNWSIVSSTVNGSRTLTIHYSNGTSTNVTMNMIVNGGAPSLLTFPPTGAWTTYSTITTSATLTTQNNQVKMQVAYPGATSPVLSALNVSDSVPAAPAAPTGLTYLALTNAPKFDSSEWIQLSWNQVPGATYYDIQRNGLWIAINVPTNRFTDVHVGTSGAAFNYNIIAVNAGGTSSSAITAYSLTGFPITMAANVNGPGSVTTTCAASYNASSYNVYRATNASGPFTEIAAGVGTSYTDNLAPGGTDYYYMTAYNGLTESLPSSIVSVNVTPSMLAITGEPASQTNSVGGNVSFTVGATGYPVLTYQWQAGPPGGPYTNLVNGVNISGATNATLSLTAITTNQALSYIVIVTNYQGSVTSAPPAMLTVNLSPTIVTPPASQSATLGATVSFNVTAAGVQPLSYQWQVTNRVSGGFMNLGNAGQISGVNTNVLTISGVTPSLALAYRVIVSNSYGAVTSAPPAILTVGTQIAINNYSFENPVVTENSYTSFGTAAPPSWSASGVANAVVAVVNPGATDGRGYGANPAGLDASNYCQIFCTAASGTGIIYEDTGVKYQAGTTYQLTAAFGLEGGTFDTGSSLVLYNSALTSMAANVISAANLTLGKFTNFSVTYTGTGSEGGNGDIVVGFKVPSSAGTGFFDFDNVRLTTRTAFVPGTNAYLTSLALNPPGTLSPAFATNTFTYTATNALGSNPTVTVTNADPTAISQLIFNGATNGLTSGQPSAPLTLAPGLNLVQVRVTAQDGVTVQTYTVNVTVPGSVASTNAYLTSLTLNPALTFAPAFASNVLSYAATEAYGSVPTVTVTNADLTAANQLIYNGATNLLASGAMSSLPVLNLNLGTTNVVQVQVTAQDGLTMQTYTVNVIEQPSQTVPKLTNSVSNGTLTLSWPADHLGYRLLLQTNNLSKGVSTNPTDWGTVPGSMSVTTTNLLIIQTNLDEFYRLVYP